MDPDAGIGGPRPAGYHANAGLAGKLAVGAGHIGRAALVAIADQANILVVNQRIQHRQIAFARHPEYGFHALRCQTICQNFATGSHGLLL